ncbi:MAG: SRPBCC family protein [Proteobacteria bacterium]|nr:SRPBCC family protein [Pseudomonadota bacterium]
MHDVTRFELVTRWRLEAPIEVVFDALHAAHEWPRWWHYVRAVEELAPGGCAGVGSVRRYTWSTRLPYRLSFDLRVTRVDYPTVLEGEAHGELEGLGRWTLSSQGSATIVRYDWIVFVTKAWMRVFAPLLAPVFRWNHVAVMNAGEQGLARHLANRAREDAAQGALPLEGQQ